MERTDTGTGVEQTNTCANSSDSSASRTDYMGEVLVEPVLIEKSVALDRVRSHSWRGLLRRQVGLDARLLFKPFWHVPVVLDHTGGGWQAARESMVMVDGITGVGRFLPDTRHRTPPRPSRIDPHDLLSPSVSSEAAQRSITKIVSQLQVKEGRGVQVKGSLRLIYRPVWIIFPAKGTQHYLIDAYTGYVTKTTASSRASTEPGSSGTVRSMRS